MPGMSSYDHAKTSKYDLNNLSKLSLSFVDKVVSILNSLSWFAVPRSTVSRSSKGDETRSSIQL